MASQRLTSRLHGEAPWVVGCLLDVVVAVVLFVVIGLVSGEAHSGHGRESIHLTTIPTLVFIALLLGYYFGYRRPAKRRRQAGE